MAERIPARLTAAEGRRFGLTVGAAFLVLAAIAALRGRTTTALALGALGFALAAAGLAIPSHLGPVFRAWMGLAHAISRVTTPVILGVLYFVIVTPTGWLRRVTGHPALDRRKSESGFWVSREVDQSRDAMEHQF